MSYQSRKKNGIKNPIRCGSTSTDLEESASLHWLELWVGKGGHMVWSEAVLNSSMVLKSVLIHEL